MYKVVSNHVYTALTDERVMLMCVNDLYYVAVKKEKDVLGEHTLDSYSMTPLNSLCSKRNKHCESLIAKLGKGNAYLVLHKPNDTYLNVVSITIVANNVHYDLSLDVIGDYLVPFRLELNPNSY